MRRASDATVVRHGPREAVGARTVRVAGQRVTFAVLLELRGDAAPEEQRMILAGLRDRALEELVEGHGGVTARLRDAHHAIDQAVRSEAGGRSGPLIAGAALLAVGEHGIVLAHAGPVVAYHRTEADAPRRIPARGPWLKRESIDATSVDEPGAEPLGAGLGRIGGPDLHWEAIPPAPGTRLLVVGASTAGVLSRDVAAALFRTPPPRVGDALATALAPGQPAIFVAPADPRGDNGVEEITGRTMAPGDAEAQTIGGGPTGPFARSAPIGRRTGVADLARRARPLTDRGRAALRAAGGATARGAARVLLGLFPARMAADRGGADWMRLAATAALGLPVAVLALTLLLALRERGPGDAIEAAAGGGGAAPLVDATGADDALAADPIADRAAGIQRLGDVRLEAALAGGAEDPRDIVAVGDARYVLNRTLGLVEWVRAGEARAAWRQGLVVNGAVAGAPVDLFWLPATGGGEGGQAAVLDAAARLWLLDGESATPVGPLDDSSWRVVTRAAGYDGRLYVLDRGGRVHRYARTDGLAGEPPSFPGPPEAWLQQDLDLSQAIDMAIDGRILVLLAGGDLRALQAGGDTGLRVGGMPERIGDARAVYGSPSADQILVADAAGGQVIALGGDGVFRARLLLPPQPRAPSGSALATGRLENFHALWWDEADGHLWLVSGNALYRTAYQGSPALRP